MLSIAREHQQRTLDAMKLKTKDPASLRIAATSTANRVQASKMRTVLNALSVDVERLREISVIDDKVALKRNELVPKYLSYVNEAIEQNVLENTLIVQVMVWALDIGDIETAMKLADISIDHDFGMPERFSRDVPTYMAEELTAWAQLQFDDGVSSAPYFDEVLSRVEAGKWPVNQPIVLNKIYKLKAMLCELENDWDNAVRYYDKCVKVNPKKHGVKARLQNANEQRAVKQKDAGL